MEDTIDGGVSSHNENVPFFLPSLNPLYGDFAVKPDLPLLFLFRPECLLPKSSGRFAGTRAAAPRAAPRHRSGPVRLSAPGMGGTFLTYPVPHHCSVRSAHRTGHALPARGLFCFPEAECLTFRGEPAWGREPRAATLSSVGSIRGSEP